MNIDKVPAKQSSSRQANKRVINMNESLNRVSARSRIVLFNLS